MGTLSFAKHLGFPSFVSWETEEPITEPDITLIMVVVVIYPCFIGCDLGKFIANTLSFLRGNWETNEWRLRMERKGGDRIRIRKHFLEKGGGANIAAHLLQVMLES